ncbi:MAG TPA: hypothetical protein HA362_03105 [Nanoarchaeota archaeon]|nr:hypothetical protein [Nanoarchaeota archaeon]
MAPTIKRELTAIVNELVKRRMRTVPVTPDQVWDSLAEQKDEILETALGGKIHSSTYGSFLDDCITQGYESHKMANMGAGIGICAVAGGSRAIDSEAQETMYEGPGALMGFFPCMFSGAVAGGLTLGLVGMLLGLAIGGGAGFYGGSRLGRAFYARSVKKALAPVKKDYLEFMEGRMR